jgi:hypothetical protein
LLTQKEPEGFDRFRLNHSSTSGKEIQENDMAGNFRQEKYFESGFSRQPRQLLGVVIGGESPFLVEPLPFSLLHTQVEETAGG